MSPWRPILTDIKTTTRLKAKIRVVLFRICYDVFLKIAISNRVFEIHLLRDMLKFIQESLVFKKLFNL